MSGEPDQPPRGESLRVDWAEKLRNPRPTGARDNRRRRTRWDEQGSSLGKVILRRIPQFIFLLIFIVGACLVFDGCVELNRQSIDNWWSMRMR
jgi:hypothetical protein